MDGQPDPADQPGAVGDDEPAAVVAVSAGGVWKGGLVVPAAVEQEKDRPSVLDGLRLMRRHRGRIQRFLSKREGNERITEGDAA